MSTEQDVQVKAIRSFEGEEGFKTPGSAVFIVSRQRAADLKANGLVEEVSAKKAPEPENKMAAKAQNKSGEKPEAK